MVIRRISVTVGFIALWFLLAPVGGAHTGGSAGQSGKPQTQSSPPAAGAANAQVIALVKAGATEANVIAFVKNHDGKFDVAAKDIVALTKAGVSEAVIDAMIAKAATGAPSATSPTPTTASPAPPSPAPAPSRLTVKDGTQVRLQLAESLSSATAKPNEPVKLVVVEDVVLDGHLVLRKGTLASGKLTVATRQLLTRGGRLEVSAESVQLADGTDAKLRGTLAAAGGRGLVLGNEATISSNADLVATVEGTVNMAIITSGQTGSGSPRAQGAREPVPPGAASAGVPSEERPQGRDTIPAPVKDGEAAMFESRLTLEAGIAGVKRFFDAKNVDYNLNADTNRVNTDWYGNRRCGPGIQHCENRASVRITSEAGHTVVRVQVFERKREGGLSPRPWNENSKNKGKETTELAVELQRTLSK